MPRTQRSRLIGCFALGVSIGGFFDGILLHQILQWHHLLSGLASRAADLRLQVMADGIFHLAMYVLLLVGLGLLWRQRRDPEMSEFTVGTAMAWTLMGFGAWHVLDAVLSHWLLGLHRVKMDSPNPLFWDLLWFAVFGIGPLLLGWRFPKGPLRSRPTVLIFGLSAVAIGAAVASLLPAARGSPQAVLFGENNSASAIVQAIAAANGSVVSTDASGTLWVVRFESPVLAYQLYRSGAIMVGGAPAAGCLTYSVPAVAPPA
ncbi:DUF2243 domain-containing protein [Sinorhizobium fredii]|uniref:DUF2243 domain-containing protein n=1 Tax=Rhizobium fredii TaxID=380 RepID=UPI001F182EAD|nr:DUF2243 domain-containing protein [Sinorhizobium fredii]